ncbi:hypothetical protein BGW39_005340 [Mortierella sp. 14UC]|nr:hypothetical protein BGW39_005340 [Mortierella sp. 14UC]
MSQEQPAYYSPAQATTGAPGTPGTPQYQYVTPQPTDQQQYIQPQQQYIQPQQQQYAAPQPGTTLQQPYYPAQTPTPVFQQAVVSPQFKEQPAAVYASADGAHLAQPVVITAEGGQHGGLYSKIHQFEMCCGFIPLHTGAMIIAALMFIFYGWCGLALLTSGTYRLMGNDAVYIVTLVLGVVYVLVAAISAHGFIGAYRQDPKMVNVFVKFFVIGSLVWAVLEIIQMGALVALYSSYCSDLAGYGYSCGFPWISWIFTFLIGLGFQYYFACCLVSYQRVLLASLGDIEGAQAIGGKNIEMH